MGNAEYMGKLELQYPESLDSGVHSFEFSSNHVHFNTPTSSPFEALIIFDFRLGSLSCQPRSSAPSLLPGPALLPPTGATGPTAPPPPAPPSSQLPAPQLPQSARPPLHTGQLALPAPQLLLLPLVLVPSGRTLHQAQSALLPTLVLLQPMLAPSPLPVSLPPPPLSWHKRLDFLRFCFVTIHMATF